MNEIQIFKNKDFSLLKPIEKDTPEYFGYVYILEYGDFLKIGKSKNIYQRISALSHQGAKYSDLVIGDVAILPKCTNYGDIEKEVHRLLHSYAKEDTELFKIGFRDAIAIIQNSNLNFKDESEYLNKRSDIFLNGMKNFFVGKTDSIIFH